MKQIIYLIRHGHTSGTESNLMYGSTDLPLTEDGQKEIAAFAEAGIYPDPEGAEIWTSGMFRTEQTLYQMYGSIDHMREPLLKEIDLGVFEMMSVEEVYEDDYGRAWLSGEIEKPSFEGGDSHESFEDRINRGLLNLLNHAADHGKDRIIAVLHGAVITYIMNRAFPDVYEDMWNWTPNPGTGYALEIVDGQAAAWTPVGDTGVRVIPA